MLGGELWVDDLGSLLNTVKNFLADVCESRKLKLYGDNACPGPQPNSSGGDLGQDGVSCGLEGMAGVAYNS